MNTTVTEKVNWIIDYIINNPQKIKGIIYSALDTDRIEVASFIFEVSENIYFDFKIVQIHHNLLVLSEKDEIIARTYSPRVIEIYNVLAEKCKFKNNQIEK